MSEQDVYEAVVPVNPDPDGYYVVTVQRNGSHVSGSTIVTTDRAEAITKARAFVAWHREHSDDTETIRL